MPAGEERLRAYARDAVRILAESLRLCAEGRPEFYRVAAVQLRLLLCDTTHRHNELVSLALLPRLLPQFSLPLLTPEGAFDAQRRLPLEEWLAQPLPASTLSLRQFIRRVCDQDGGAHVDVREEERSLPDAARWVVLIGRMVGEELERVGW